MDHVAKDHVSSSTAANHLPGLELSNNEKEMATKLEQDVKHGDLNSMQKDLNQFHGHTGELKKVMGKVQQDESKEGVYVIPTFGEKDSTVQVFNKKGGYDMNFSTDPHDGGPGLSKVAIDKKGNFNNDEVGYMGDTKKIFGEITHGK